jgi:hypothetical protein
MVTLKQPILSHPPLIKFSTGIVLVLDTVLTPPTTVPFSINTLGLKRAAEWISTSGISTPLAQILGLTYLIPTDDALAAFLQSNPSIPFNNQIVKANLLKYHILSGVYLGAYLIGRPSQSVFGTYLTNQSVIMSNNNGTLSFNNPLSPNLKINVVRSDILVDQGVVHFIDGLILPVGVDLTQGDLSINQIYPAGII